MIELRVRIKNALWWNLVFFWLGKERFESTFFKCMMKINSHRRSLILIKLEGKPETKVENFQHLPVKVVT